MKNKIAAILLLILSGCASSPTDNAGAEPDQKCLGSVNLPAEFAGLFESVEDKQLLSKALGTPNKGGLCQGKVYLSKENVSITLFRAWNSTNPNSKLGKWWAFNKPEGAVSKYRSDYEICYQWSPLDMLVSCLLKPSTKVVVGTGQSAACSAYLTYPVSDKQQIYIDDSSSSLIDCITYEGVFSWK